jgi:hypothetical protein
MERPEKAPCQAVGLARGVTDLRHLEYALSIKQTETPQAPATAAGRYICQRFHHSPVTADLVAYLAGLGSDRRRA